jgi:hypothetical protein
VIQNQDKPPNDASFSSEDLKKQVALAPVDEQMNNVTAMASLMKNDSKEMVILQAFQIHSDMVPSCTK